MGTQESPLGRRDSSFSPSSSSFLAFRWGAWNGACDARRAARLGVVEGAPPKRAVALLGAASQPKHFSVVLFDQSRRVMLSRKRLNENGSSQRRFRVLPLTLDTGEV